MKKLFFTIILLLFPIGFLAYDTTDQLLIDIKIREDGSLFVRELASLEGQYNGRLRDIYYANNKVPTFTGKDSDFAGSSIYNATAINNLKVGDINYRNNYTFADLDNVNSFYRLTSSDDNDYGYYNLTKVSNGIDLKIYNNTSRAFYLEYVVENAVVVHNDIAELAWNILGDSYKEYINKLEVRISLPKRDTNLRAWLHGTIDAYGIIELENQISSKTTYLNLPSYSPVSVRMMFDKDLILTSSKKSGINGQGAILRYEQEQADLANEQRERQYQEIKERVLAAVTNAENLLTVESYGYAYGQVSLLKKDSVERNEAYQRLAVLPDKIDIKNKEAFDTQLKVVEKKLLRSEYKKAMSIAQMIYNNDLSQELINKLEPFLVKIEQKEQQRTVILTILSIGSMGAIIYLIRKMKKENDDLSTFNIDYYREFPTDDEPSTIDYLINYSVTDNSFSATILNLITKKVIEVEQIDKKNYLFRKVEHNITTSYLENKVLNILFEVVGNDNEVTLEQLKKFGNRTKNAELLLDKYSSFKKSATKIASDKKIYDYQPKKRFKILGILLLVALVNISLNSYYEIDFLLAINTVITIILAIRIFSIILRTPYGVDTYKKWSAHKKFLKDFGIFPDKELPEINLWEKYLVYATVLGVASKLQKTMATRLANLQSTDPTFADIYTRHLILNHYINSNLTKTINSAMTSSIQTARTTISPSASGGGFGGGSSGGGGSFGGGGGGGRF